MPLLSDPIAAPCLTNTKPLVRRTPRERAFLETQSGGRFKSQHLTQAGSDEPPENGRVHLLLQDQINSRDRSDSQKILKTMGQEDSDREMETEERDVGEEEEEDAAAEDDESEAGGGEFEEENDEVII